MDEMQGVMALPEAQGPGMQPEDMAIFEEIRRNVPRQEITKEFLDAGAQADPQAVAEFKQELAGLELTPDELNKLNTMVDAILAAPQDYASLRRAYLAEGISEDLLPEQFDPAFFAALNMALDTIAMNPGPPPPMAMARGGVADLAAYGRNGDTMLAHITPQEAAMLKRMGGSGTINPYTGLPEYGNIFKSIGKAVKKFAKSTVGKVLIGAALFAFAGPAAAGFLSGAAGSVGLTGLSGFLTSQVGISAVGGFLAGAGTTLAAGGNLKQALKAGAIGGVTAGALQGIGGAIQGKSAADLFTTPPITDAAASAVSPTGALPPGGGLPTLTETAAAPPSMVEVGAPFAPQPTGGPAPMSGDTLTAADRAIPAQPMVPRAPIERAPSLYQTAIDVPPGQSFPPSTGTIGQTSSSGSGGIMDLIRQGEYGKAATSAYDRIMPEALGGQRGAVTPDMIENMRPKAIDLVTAKNPSFALRAATDPAAKTIFDNLVTDQATKLATPGMLSTYGPLAALGVGALGAMGGFKSKEATPPDMAMFRGPSPQQLAAARLNYGGIRPTAYGGYYSMPGYAEGGGVMDTPQAMRVGGKTYPRKTGAINGPGTGTSDSIPAMLSDGEFVFTAKAVRAMGNGSRRKGAKKMYQLMKMLEGKAA